MKYDRVGGVETLQDNNNALAMFLYEGKYRKNWFK